MKRWLLRSLRISMFAGTALVLVGCCNNRGDSEPSESRGHALVPSPRLPSDWRVVRDFVASDAETTEMGTQMKAKLVGVRNTAYDVKGGRVQINTILAKGPQDAYKVVRYLLNIKPTEMMLRNKNAVFEFVGQNDVLPRIKTGREHLMSTRQGFPVKVAAGVPQQRIKRPPRFTRDGGATADGGVDGGS